MAKSIAANSYPRLLTQIKNTIESGREEIEQVKARVYWRVGERISKHLLIHNGRAGYGKSLYKKLSKDLKIGERTLYRTVQFYDTYPILSARTKLDWGHYRSLITVDDPALRARLLKKAERSNLSTRQLASEIKQTQPTPKTQSAPLTPQKGPLNVYQSVNSPLVPVAQGSVLLDCGFNVWKAVSRKEFKAGQIVRTRAKMSFTYRAYVEEIIDGDTFWVEIDLGFDSYTRQKLRLRGIDCPELNTAAGKRAKAFVAKAFEGLEYIVIRSSKSDKYDRYLADVFYGKDETFINQQLIDEGLAVEYKE